MRTNVAWKISLSICFLVLSWMTVLVFSLQTSLECARADIVEEFKETRKSLHKTRDKLSTSVREEFDESLTKILENIGSIEELKEYQMVVERRRGKFYITISEKGTDSDD